MAKTIYPVVAGAIPTRLVTSFSCDTSTSIELESVQYVPTAPNHLTIKDDTNTFVTIEYTSIDGNVISGITFVEGDMYHIFQSGSVAVRCFDKYDYDALKENIEETVDNIKGVKLNGVELTPDAEHKVNVPHATAGVLGLIKVGNNLSVRADGTLDAEDVVYDYTDLTSKPQINSVELVGNKTSSQLGLVPASHLTDNNPHGITKLTLGLGNVDNTRDMDKPVSTAMQTALMVEHHYRTYLTWAIRTVLQKNRLVLGM